MSESKTEDTKKIIKTSEDLNTFLQDTDEDAKFTGILELSKDMLPSTLPEYGKFKYDLFGKEIVRVPIIGFNDKKIFCLFTNENKQTHMELLIDLEDFGYSENDINFTTSIELGGSGRYPLTLKNGFEKDPKNRLSVTFGRGSDVYDPQFTDEGIKRIEEIFDGEIRQI